MEKIKKVKVEDDHLSNDLTFVNENNERIAVAVRHSVKPRFSLIPFFFKFKNSFKFNTFPELKKGLVDLLHKNGHEEADFE